MPAPQMHVVRFDIHHHTGLLAGLTTDGYVKYPSKTLVDKAAAEMRRKYRYNEAVTGFVCSRSNIRVEAC